MYRHSLIVVILLECFLVSCTGGSVCLYPKTTTIPTSDHTTVHPGQHHELQFGTESEVPLSDVRVAGRKTGLTGSPAAVRNRRSGHYLCHATLATKIDNCTQTFERLFAEHVRTLANTVTHLEAQHLCRQYDESLYCLHIELKACPPRADHLERIEEGIGDLRRYMEVLCRYVRQTQQPQASSTVPINSSPPLESHILHKKFNQPKHTGYTVLQKTATDRFQPATDKTADSFGYVSQSNQSSKMLLNDNVQKVDQGKLSNMKAFERNATEADSVLTSLNSDENSSAATKPIVEPQILSKRNNARTHNSSPSRVPDFRCLCFQLICGFILTVATLLHRH